MEKKEVFSEKETVKIAVIDIEESQTSSDEFWKEEKEE